MKRKTLSLLIALAAVVAAQAREKININLGWKFIREAIKGAQAPEYNDAKWQTVDLPHDAAVHHEFQKKGDGASSRVGFLPLGRGWYRRHIAYDKAWQGKRVIIEFEGVYRDARVYVNGVDCGGRNTNGYLDFEYDITDMLRDGDNVVAVSYDNTFRSSSRWYNGEGINRDVWLHVVDPVHVARYGTYITTPKISADRALVAIETSVLNQRRDSVLCRLVTDIVDYA